MYSVRVRSVKRSDTPVKLAHRQEESVRVGCPGAEMSVYGTITILRVANNMAASAVAFQKDELGKLEEFLEGCLKVVKELKE